MQGLIDAADALEVAAPTLPAAMTAAEVTLLRAVAGRHVRAIEFGCGGSTSVLLDAGLRRLLSVDSDAAWLARVAAQPDAAVARADGRWQPVHQDIGALGPWGWPVEPTSLARWPAYWRDAWDVAGAVDCVFVDGRFRVACALFALPRLPAGASLLVHDFWSRAAYRAPLLRHAEVMGSAGTLALLAPRRVLDAALLAADLAAYAFDPR